MGVYTLVEGDEAVFEPSSLCSSQGSSRGGFGILLPFFLQTPAPANCIAFIIAVSTVIIFL